MFAPRDVRPPTPQTTHHPTPNHRGRRRQFTPEQHLARGSYRADRHGPLPGLDQPPVRVCWKPVPARPRAVAAKWITGPADAAAVDAGYWFDIRLGKYAAEWIETQLQLVEGVWSGVPFRLMPWQRDVVHRLFGWVTYSKDWDRIVRRFRRALVMVPKKNGKSPFAAALGLYLTYGDFPAENPEHGAEVVIVAKDKIQSENVFKHCRRMVKRCPAFEGALAVNDREARILDLRTESTCRAMAHDPDQLEGINPRALVCDELHVWRNQRTWDSIRYAGATRPDYLLLAITTAGDDRQSLCFSQYEYAKNVETGTITDHELFSAIYEAPAEADWTKPAVWKAANPSLGTTIQPSEFAAACNEAKHNSRLQSAFKRYRLNIWTQPETAWLDAEYWAACGADYTLEDFIAAGQPAALGLDLSKTKDFTAAVLAYRDWDSDTLHLWPLFWLPETVARRRNPMVPFLDWGARGHLRISPEDTVNYTMVYDDLAALADRLYITAVYYDPWNADHMTEKIQTNLGIERIKFPQTISNFNAPCKEFERRILAGEIVHPRNPVLTWQASHVLIYEDPNGNMRPVRRSSTDHRSIDGIVAALMATAGILQEAPAADFAFPLR